MGCCCAKQGAQLSKRAQKEGKAVLKEIDQAIIRADADGDGHISMQEFRNFEQSPAVQKVLMIFQSSDQKGGLFEFSKTWFGRADASRSGDLSINELRWLRGELGRMLTTAFFVFTRTSTFGPGDWISPTACFRIDHNFLVNEIHFRLVRRVESRYSMPVTRTRTVSDGKGGSRTESYTEWIPQVSVYNETLADTATNGRGGTKIEEGYLRPGVHKIEHENALQVPLGIDYPGTFSAVGHGHCVQGNGEGSIGSIEVIYEVAAYTLVHECGLSDEVKKNARCAGYDTSHTTVDESQVGSRGRGAEGGPPMGVQLDIPTDGRGTCAIYVCTMHDTVTGGAGLTYNRNMNYIPDGANCLTADYGGKLETTMDLVPNTCCCCCATYRDYLRASVSANYTTLNPDDNPPRGCVPIGSIVKLKGDVSVKKPTKQLVPIASIQLHGVNLQAGHTSWNGEMTICSERGKAMNIG